MDELARPKYAERARGIERDHRGLKQECGVARSRVRVAGAQRAHIGRAIRASVRFEHHRLVTGVSWWEAKTGIVREAVRAYLAAPRYTLPSTAYLLSVFPVNPGAHGVSGPAIGEPLRKLERSDERQLSGVFSRLANISVEVGGVGIVEERPERISQAQIEIALRKGSTG
jgi:hypothetical protein